MTKVIKGKILGIAIACLLVASLIGVAGAVAPATLAQDAAAVGIDPADSGEVNPGDSFTVDVMVNAGGHDLNGISIEVQYDATAMATSAGQVTGHNLLGGLEIGPDIDDGSVTYDLASGAGQAGVLGSVLTIEFTIDAAAEPGDYDITLATATLVEPPANDVGAEVTHGTVTVPGAPPPAGPSVSIDPETQDVVAGGSFTIDVLVDSADNDLMGIDVEIQYNADAMTTSEDDIEAHNDLLGDDVMALPGYPKVTDGKVRHAIVNIVEAVAVDGSLMTIEFIVNEDAEPGDYDLTITVADLLDEAGLKIAGVARNDGTVTVLPAGPQVFDQTFGPKALAKGVRDPICTIPAGATELDIDLSTAASPGPDMDLELYDGATRVVGEGGKIKRAPGGTYEGDTFGYSGYSGGVEFITAAGPLGQAYDLMVYAYRAGTYTVHVYYEIPVGVDLTPPEIDIEVTASTPTVGEPVTVTVTADDPSGVWMVYFMVSSPLPEGLFASSLAPQVAYEDMIQWVMSFSDEASVTFAPGWAGTYTVDAWAMDELGNMTPEGNPVTETFEVVA